MSPGAATGRSANPSAAAAAITIAALVTPSGIIERLIFIPR
jgi:hypothetical protein